MSDDEHEAVCAKVRHASSTKEMQDPTTLRRVLREMREPGWPDALELAREAATTPRGRIYDVFDGGGGGGAFFRAQIPGPWRYYVECSFDIMLVGGIKSPSMMVRHVAHNARVCAQLSGDAHAGHELHMLANLFEEFPAQAVDYAAEWAIHFHKRMERA